jgi:hypothetical protein
MARSGLWRLVRGPMRVLDRRLATPRIMHSIDQARGKKIARFAPRSEENVLQDFYECVQLSLMSSLMDRLFAVVWQGIDEALQANFLEKEVVSVSWVGLAR